MQRARILFFIGLWVAVLPYLGFPLSWKNILFILTGLTLMYVSYVVYGEYRVKHGAKRIFENFSENLDFTKRKKVVRDPSEMAAVEEEPIGESETQ